MKPFIILYALVFGLLSCAPRKPPVERPESKNGMQAVDYEAAAKALDHQGRHLEASLYYEAALRNGDDESRLLPLLIAAQIRADRLRAAKQSIERLIEIRGDDATLAALLALVTQYTPAVDDDDVPDEEMR